MVGGSGVWQRSGSASMGTPAKLSFLFRLARSRRARIAFAVFFGLAGAAVVALTIRHYASLGWPLSGANVWLVLAAGALFLVAFALKGMGWRRLFARHERPDSHALAAANAAASVTGVALPGRFDDLVRVAVLRRFRSRAGLGAVCLSLVVIGLIDSAALAPLASVAAGIADVSKGVQAGLAVVGAAGVGAALIVLALPRVSRSARLARFRLARWLGRHSTGPLEASRAWLLVSLSWALRAVALFILLHALGVSHSFVLALLFLSASAASAVLPVGPAGAATQAGAGAAVLAVAGVKISQAVAFALAAQALLVLAGAAVVVLAGAWETRLRLAAARL